MVTIEQKNTVNMKMAPKKLFCLQFINTILNHIGYSKK